MIVSKESRKTIETARMPTSATRICISLASNPDSEKKIHQAGRGLPSPAAAPAPHVMKMARDAPILEAKIKGMCSDCTVDYRNAHGDAPAQLTQAEAALAGGANVLVLDPVDATTASAIVARAKARQVPVI